MKCKQCNSELTGKKQYCNDTCSKQYRRNLPQFGGNPDTMPDINPDITNPDNIVILNPDMVSTVTVTEPVAEATRTNPDNLNYGKPMSMHQLDVDKLKANRVPIPGDHDYSGVCKQEQSPWDGLKQSMVATLTKTGAKRDGQ